MSDEHDAEDNAAETNEASGGDEPVVDPDAIPTNPNLLDSEPAADSEREPDSERGPGSEPAAGSEPTTEPPGAAPTAAGRAQPPAWQLPAIAGGAGLGLGLIITLIVYFASAAPAKDRATALDDQLTAANSEIDEIEGVRDEQAVEIENLEKRVAFLDNQNAELSTEAVLAEQALAAMRATQTELEERLQEEIKNGSVLVKEREGELVVDLIDRVVFDSGEAELNEKGKEVLEQVGETLKKVPDKLIQVAGHTDNLPISDKLIEKFPTNWELSTARAINVVRFLQEEMKIRGKRLAAVGYSEYRPKAHNRSRAGRRKNRRIEVTLLPLRRRR